MAPMKFFGFVKWGGSKKEASTVDFTGSEPGHFPHQGDGSQSPTSPTQPYPPMSKKEKKEREKQEKRERKMREKEMKMAAGRGGWANEEDDYARGGMGGRGGGYARSISPISVTSLELERKANARMVKEGHGVLEQALSMVKEHQQLLASDATYWKLRIDELKKTHPLKFGKFSKKKKADPKFRDDCNTLLSEVQKAVQDRLSSPPPPNAPGNKTPTKRLPSRSSSRASSPAPLPIRLRNQDTNGGSPKVSFQNADVPRESKRKERSQSYSAAPTSQQQQQQQQMMMNGANGAAGGANVRRHESLSVPSRSGGGAPQLKPSSSSRSHEPEVILGLDTGRPHGRRYKSDKTDILDETTCRCRSNILVLSLQANITTTKLYKIRRSG
ncbi:hypothetical protein BKA70DRAFT_690841 [Coprinopsis sp. MPI-PUGE-AT-0042]|nr:hypothetical protein BKA70DRAFT_690841 [Coprinopsis sp. MPI-PUGE-AT-0042]